MEVSKYFMVLDKYGYIPYRIENGVVLVDAYDLNNPSYFVTLSLSGSVIGNVGVGLKQSQIKTIIGVVRRNRSLLERGAFL